MLGKWIERIINFFKDEANPGVDCFGNGWSTGENPPEQVTTGYNKDGSTYPKMVRGAWQKGRDPKLNFRQQARDGFFGPWHNQMLVETSVLLVVARFIVKDGVLTPANLQGLKTALKRAEPYLDPK